MRSLLQAFIADSVSCFIFYCNVSIPGSHSGDDMHLFCDPVNSSCLIRPRLLFFYAGWFVGTALGDILDCNPISHAILCFWSNFTHCSCCQLLSLEI